MDQDDDKHTEKVADENINVPSPRFGSVMAVKQGILYLFGGMVEDGDVTYTLKDFYCLGK